MPRRRSGIGCRCRNAAACSRASSRGSGSQRSDVAHAAFRPCGWVPWRRAWPRPARPGRVLVAVEAGAGGDVAQQALAAGVGAGAVEHERERPAPAQGGAEVRADVGVPGLAERDRLDPVRGSAPQRGIGVVRLPPGPRPRAKPLPRRIQRSRPRARAGAESRSALLAALSLATCGSPHPRVDPRPPSSSMVLQPRVLLLIFLFTTPAAESRAGPPRPRSVPIGGEPGVERAVLRLRPS